MTTAENPLASDNLDDVPTIQDEPESRPGGIPLYVWVIAAVLLAIPVGRAWGDGASQLELLPKLILRALTALAAPLELPHQKVGLWQQSVSRDGTAMAAGSSQVCLDAAVEDKMSVFGQQMANKMCQSQKVAHNLDGSWSSDSVCMLGTGLKMSGHTVVTGNFNSKIVMTTELIPSLSVENKAGTGRDG